MAAARSSADAETIRQTAGEILSRPEYQLESSAQDDSLQLQILLKVLEWILRPVRWLLEQLEWLPGWLRWTVVIGLLVMLFALLAHIVWTMVASVRVHRRPRFDIDENRHRDPTEFEHQADAMAGRGDYLGAVRLLFRAMLLRLEEQEGRPFRPGTTNRELLQRVSRSPISGNVRTLVETIDVAWFGEGECGADDFHACRTAYNDVRSWVTRPANALSA